jgi:hypothetical protein
MRSATPDYLGKITIFKKSDGPLTKKIALRDDGTLTIDSTACWLSIGSAHSATIYSVQELADTINHFTSSEAYTHGRLRNGLPGRVSVVVRDKLNGATDVIARTREFLVFEEGEPGFVLLDIDFKGMPDIAKRRLEESGGIWSALCEVHPVFETVAFVERPSTSSGLRNTTTGQLFPSTGGRHIAIPVLDAADIPRFLSDLHDHFWRIGWGWGMSSVAGSFLERGLIDRSVGTPEHLIFEGQAIIMEPLEQTGRDAVTHSGTVLDTRLILPLTAAEKAELQGRREAERVRLLSEMNAKRVVWSTSHINRMTDAGVPEVDARERVYSWIDRRELSGDFPLPFDDAKFAGTTVAQVLAAPAEYIDKTLGDPLDPADGRGKAKLYKRHDGSLWIKSFAHGVTSPR